MEGRTLTLSKDDLKIIKESERLLVRTQATVDQSQASLSDAAATYAQFELVIEQSRKLLKD